MLAIAELPAPPFFGSSSHAPNTWMAGTSPAMTRFRTATTVSPHPTNSKSPAFSCPKQKTKLSCSAMRNLAKHRCGRGRESESGSRRSPTTQEVSRDGRNFFIWIRPNRLKSPESAKENQANPKTFVWIYLELFGFAGRELARWLNPRAHGGLS